MKQKTLISLNLLIIFSFFGCKRSESPRILTVEPLPPLLQYRGIKIMDGGYGSSLAMRPGDSRHLYLLTDRGPNFDTGKLGEKCFAIPEYIPHIGEFEIEGDRLKLIRKIFIKDSEGNPLSGLPNPIGSGGTGETAVDLEGQPLKADVRGLDSEGLVALADGSFWVSDEYGPHILHIDGEGKTIEKINPFEGRRLPRVFAKRWPNRGMEGLTITPDQKYLVGMMQSPLWNPKGSESKLTRILFFEIETGKTKQYLYPLEATDSENSEIAAVSNTEFLVIERDEKFYPEAEYKRVYKIKIDPTETTDVTDQEDRDTGRMYDGKTIEQLNEADLEKYKIKVVEKELVLDLLRKPINYPHDKPEGIVILGRDLIAVSNDDDFGITSIGGNPAQKLLPASGEVDSSQIYLIRLARPLF